MRTALRVGAVTGLMAMAACAPAPLPAVADEPVAVVDLQQTARGADVPFISLAPRQGRPCGDVVGLSSSGPFTAAIVMIGFERDLVDATEAMVACVTDNGLEVEVTSGG